MTEEQYKNAIAALDRLIDIVGEDENHPLIEKLEVIAGHIEEYEKLAVAELDIVE